MFHIWYRLLFVHWSVYNRKKKEKEKGEGNNSMNYDLHDKVGDKWNTIWQNVQNPGYVLCAG